MTDVTWDNLFSGALKIKQKKKGYRYSIDPVLLSHFIKPDSNVHIIDLGTGSGIIPAIISHRHKAVTLTGIEIQKSLAAIALDNIKENGLESRISILCGDMRLLDFTGLPPAGLIVSNPPYMKHSAGRLNPDPEMATARHEITITLKDLVRIVSALLVKGGRFAVIYPPSRIPELERELSLNDFFQARIRPVCPFAGKPAIRVLIEAVKSIEVPVINENPLVIFKEPGVYSDEVNRMFL